MVVPQAVNAAPSGLVAIPFGTFKRSAAKKIAHQFFKFGRIGNEDI
jgi:hypothetical protein